MTLATLGSNLSIKAPTCLEAEALTTDHRLPSFVTFRTFLLRLVLRFKMLISTNKNAGCYVVTPVTGGRGGMAMQNEECRVQNGLNAEVGGLPRKTRRTRKRNRDAETPMLATDY